MGTRKRFGTAPRAEDISMDIRVRELHFRWIDTPSEPFILDEVPNPEPPPHPQPNDPPPTAETGEGESPGLLAAPASAGARQ
jgi:hypothetical protein